MEQEINDWASELNFIQVSMEYIRVSPLYYDYVHLQLTEELEGGKHAAVRVGAATTNLQMLNWSNK